MAMTPEEKFKLLGDMVMRDTKTIGELHQKIMDLRYEIVRIIKENDNGNDAREES